MINQKKRLLNALNRNLLTGIFIGCLVAVAGVIGCSDSGGGSSITVYHLTGYDDGVVTATPAAQQSLVSAMGNENLNFYAEFPWFVNLTYQAFDANQQGIGNLTVDKFSVLEGGVEVDKVKSEMNVRKRDILPSGYTYGIKTVLFLDNTPSSTQFVTLEKMLEAGQVIVDYLDEKGQQQVAIMAYDETGEAEVVQGFTDSLTDLMLSLTGGIQSSYGTTNFYGGVIKALALWEDNHSPSNPAFQQGFLVAVTDGDNTSGLSNAAAAIAARGDKQVIVVAVGNNIPESTLNDLKILGNAGFYLVTDPNLLCENILQVQNKMMAYADGFYWLRYKSLITSENANAIHPVVLSVVGNGNNGADSKISGTYNSNAFFSGEPKIYFNTSADDPDGITEKTIMITRGQGAGEVSETIKALTYMQSGYGPSQYEWTSGDTSIVTVSGDALYKEKAVVTVVGPGDTLLTVEDTENHVIQTFAIKVKVREEAFEMMKHIVTSKGPWFADATFQVRNAVCMDNQWKWTTDLVREDMTTMENGTKVDMEASELHIRKRDNIPSDYSYTLKTVLMIDNSPSARNIDNLPRIKTAAKAFAKRALVNDAADNSDMGPLLDTKGENQQEFAVVSYDENGETIIVQNFTTDLVTINAAIDGIQSGFGPIDFYGGMIESLNLWDNDQSPYDANNTAFVQGVVIVLSDGWQSYELSDRAAVLSETGDKQIICVSVGNDLVSGNGEDLVDFGNDGFYSVPNPGQTITVKVTTDGGDTSKDVTYTTLTKTLMDIQNEVYAYANSFYWLDYKSKLPPVLPCSGSESMVVTINNNSNTGTGKNVSGNFPSCQFFEGMDGALYINSTVTNPDGIKPEETIDLQYVMLGNIPLIDPTYNLEAFTYDNNGVKNTPAYEWAITSPFVLVTPDTRSYANSRATLSLPDNKQPGTTSLRIEDTGNPVFRTIPVKVERVQLPAPIAYYPFNGNADDMTGNGYDGKVSGATLTADRFGKANSAYSFNGKSDYIALEDLYYGTDAGAYSDHIDEITVCSWFKTGYDPGSNEYWGRIVDFDGSNYYQILINNAGHVVFHTNSGLTDWDFTYPIETKDAYNDNAWHFLCATYGAGGKKSIYVDGVLMAQIDVPPGQPIGTGDTRSGFIGSHYLLEMAQFWYFNGQIDDVIIFDAELTSAQIESLWQSFK